MTNFFRKIVDYIIGKLTDVDTRRLKLRMDVKEKESRLFRGIKGNKDKAETINQLMSSFKVR